jgi:hypothetical protein
MLAQLEEDLRWYVRILNMANKTKTEKKISNFAVAYNLMIANKFFRKKKNLI